MPTITDVAKRAGVSTYTVSSVLNRSARVSPELTKRVLVAVEELDYTINSVARSLQTRRTNTFGMLIPDISNPFYSLVVSGAEDVCRHRGYSLLLGTTKESRDEQAHSLSMLRSKQVDGLLLFMAAESENTLRPLIDKKIPIVFLGRQTAELPGDCVKVDNFAGIRMATRHLIARGHRNIAMLTGPASLSVNKERVKGWKEALHEAQLPINPAFIRETDWSADSALFHTTALFALDPAPTAILTSNFVMTTGVLRALKQLKLHCPSPVEVLSSDDVDWLDAFESPITAIVQPGYEMGSMGVELLLDRIANPERAVQLVNLSPTLHIRD